MAPKEKSEMEDIQGIFETLKNQKIRKILDHAKEEPMALSKIVDKIRRDDYEEFEKKIVTLNMPGDEKQWEDIHNNINVFIEQETDIQLRDKLLVIIKYKEKRQIESKKEIQKKIIKKKIEKKVKKKKIKRKKK